LNKYRRGVLDKQETALDAIHGEIQILASEEAAGRRETDEKRDERVKGWQNRVVDIREVVESVHDEEESAAENTRSEDRKSEMEEAVAQLREALDSLEELENVEDLSLFTGMWHERYDNVLSCLHSAAA
jgi:hypothetical protein